MGNKNIVVIDDEEDICFVLSFELKTSGFLPFTFLSAQEAKTFFETNTAAAVVCDFQMPKMNGLEFHQWLLSQGINIPFFILTGEPTMDTASLMEHGITDVLFKPQDLKKLAVSLNNLYS